jgi:hypothetical protein
MAKRDWVLIAGCLLAGFIGGKVAIWASSPEGAGLPGQVAGVAPVLTVSGLHVVDAAGKVRAVLDVSPDGQAGLTVRDQNETPRARLFTNADGLSLLGLLGDEGNYGILLRQANGRPDSMLMDKDGKVRLGMCVLPDGLAGLYLNQNDKQCLWLNSPAEGGPNLVLSDSQVKQRARLSLEANGTPVLMLSDQSGNAVFAAP